MPDDDDDDDDDLWEFAIRDVDEIGRVPSLVTDDIPEKLRAKPKRTPVKRPESKALPLAESAGASGKGLDRKTAEKLRKGQMPLDGRLDLHGMRQAEAHEALKVFISVSYSAGKRCVLVITGKGAGADGGRDPLSQGQGVLKRMVPEWLGDRALAGVILKTEQARSQHGGDGALYVLLRRQR